MARAVVIANPAAARTAPGTVDAIRAVFTSAGWKAEILATGGPGDATRLAEYAVREGVDVCAVFGGDGTTMQAASALVGSDVALGLLPGGTGNLLAGNLRLPTNPVRAAQAIVAGVPRRLDLGRLDRAAGSDYFAVACGAGIDALIMTQTRSEHKRRWGMLAYVATTLRFLGDIRSLDHLITVDGVEYEAHAAMVLVANCGEVIPPFVRLHSDTSPTDGLLDVVVLRANGVLDSVRAVWDLLRQGHGGDAFIGYARGREIRVETHPVTPIELDGDAGGETPFTATCVPGAILVMAPPA
ncbi:MAG: diacylglycerol kinase family lipid kinase [Gemmatimonadales bacterium]|jgi:YegS/Rv2252/BmrU family lipid kinase|nr:diacylglycerol kinase family lipid kinase [Gemmatimonadales bacterium]